MTRRSKKPIVIQEGQREPGTLGDVWAGKEDHGILTCNVQVNLKSSSQGFGGLCLTDKLLDSFLDRLCWTFNVSLPPQLKGLKCWALRPWGSWNDTIEGLESQNGRRFVLTQWRRELELTPVATRLEEKTESLRRSIAQAREQIKRNQLALKSVKENYIEWSTFTHVIG